MVDYVDGCSYIEPSKHSWDEAYLILMNDDVFDVLLDWVYAELSDTSPASHLPACHHASCNVYVGLNL